VGAGLPAEAVDLSPPRRSSSHELRGFLQSFTTSRRNSVACLKSSPALEEGGTSPAFGKTYERIASIDPREAGEPPPSSWRRSGRTVQPRGSDAPSVWGGCRRPPWSSWGWLPVTMEVLGRRAYALVESDVRSAPRPVDYSRAARSWKTWPGSSPELHTPTGTLESERAGLRGEGAGFEAPQERRREGELQVRLPPARLESLMSGKRYVEALVLVRGSAAAPW